MGKKLSNADMSGIVSSSLKGFRLVQEDAAMDARKPTARHSANVKTRIAKTKASPKTGTKPALKVTDSADEADDAIVFVESSAPPGADAVTLKKAAVISGVARKVIGVQG